MHPALTGLLFAAIPFYNPFLHLPIQPHSVFCVPSGTYMQLW